MIATLTTAEVICSRVAELRRQLELTVHLVSEEEAGEIRVYKYAVGRSMMEMFDTILEPLYKQHPSLMPEAYREWLPADWERKAQRSAELEQKRLARLQDRELVELVLALSERLKLEIQRAQAEVMGCRSMALSQKFGAITEQMLREIDEETIAPVYECHPDLAKDPGQL